MMRTMMLKLKCTEEDRTALLRTMEAYTVAFKMAADWGFANRTTNRFNAQDGVYREIRNAIPELNSSLVKTAIHCSCEALKGVKLKKCPYRRTYGAMRYSKKSIRVVLDHGFLSLTTVKGRRKINFDFPEYMRIKFDGWRVVSSTISRRRDSKDFYLGVAVERKLPTMEKGSGVLGVDRGLRNIAVTSNNEFFNSKVLNSIRGRYA
jgi:putative transposase